MRYRRVPLGGEVESDLLISTDRHTVKPWFQGKIPFAFDLPEIQNSEFSLLGGRMTYLGQTPGAHLIYDVRKHHISVFVFQEQSLRARLDENSLSPKKLSFNMETWSQEFSLAEETVVQHGNMEPGRASLFRDRRRECC